MRVVRCPSCDRELARLNPAAGGGVTVRRREGTRVLYGPGSRLRVRCPCGKLTIVT